MSGTASKALGGFWPSEGRVLAGAGGWAIMGATYAVLTLCIIYPLAMIFVAAFTEEGIGAAVREIASSDRILLALWNTILTSVIGVVIAGTVGVALAWLVGRTNMPFKRLLDPLNLIPFYLSSVVGAICWQILASPRSGILNVWLTPLVGPGCCDWPHPCRRDKAAPRSPAPATSAPSRRPCAATGSRRCRHPHRARRE